MRDNPPRTVADESVSFVPDFEFVDDAQRRVQVDVDFQIPGMLAVPQLFDHRDDRDFHFVPFVVEIVAGPADVHRIIVIQECIQSGLGKFIVPLEPVPERPADFIAVRIVQRKG